MANNIVDSFIEKYRSLDADGKTKVSDELRKKYFDELFKPEIKKPEIQNPQITPEQDTNKHNGYLDGGSGRTGGSLNDFIKKFKEVLDEARKRVDENTRTYDYTYQPGDTFGRVLMKMGLSDGSNLWGPDGDVEYYSKQLRDQGINGNIPVGTTIRLRKRQ